MDIFTWRQDNGHRAGDGGLRRYSDPSRTLSRNRTQRAQKERSDRCCKGPQRVPFGGHQAVRLADAAAGQVMTPTGS